MITRTDRAGRSEMPAAAGRIDLSSTLPTQFTVQSPSTRLAPSFPGGSVSGSNALATPDPALLFHFTIVKLGGMRFLDTELPRRPPGSPAMTKPNINCSSSEGGIESFCAMRALLNPSS